MPPIQGLIQTIVALRDLQLREAAQRLQEQQLGISQGQEHIAGQAGFQNLIQGMSNPQALAPSLSQFTGQTGLDQPTLAAMLTATPPAEATTKSAAVASGAKQLGGSQDVMAALQGLTGLTPGQSAADQLRASITGEAGRYFNELPPAKKSAFAAGVLQNVGTGQDVGAAAVSQVTADEINNMSPAEKQRMVQIGKGLAPSASESAQLQLGWANSRQQQRYQEVSLAMDDVKLHAGIAQAKAELDKGSAEELDRLVLEKGKLTQQMKATSATLTPEGIAANADAYNSLNEQIRRLAPNIYGPNGKLPLSDLPKGSTVGVTGLLPMLGGYMQGQLNPRQ